MAANTKTTVIRASGDARIDGILGDREWVGPISFGDPGRASDYEAAYPEPLSDFQRVNARQLAAVRDTLTEVSPDLPGHAGFAVTGFTNLEISYDRDRPVIRVADTSDPETAYTYNPADQSWGGDIFFGNYKGLRSPVPGNYGWYTHIHELGHALGLKHGHEATGFGALPRATDSMEYSVMTYRSYVGSDAKAIYNETWGHAQTYMMYDIAALQHLYGANFSTNSGNTTYSWNPTTGASFVNGQLALDPGGDRILETIWDGGGTDTYDMSNYAVGLRIDLRPGNASVLDPGQLAYLGGGPNGGYARGSVFNALQHQGDNRSLIENANGGSGNDVIQGNAADNRLDGGLGDDRLIGGGGDDVLIGKAGLDRMEGGTGNDTYRVDRPDDVVIEAAGAGNDTVLAASSYHLGANLESLRIVPGVLGDLTGNGLANQLTGNNLANRIAGMAGADTIEGRGGADTLIGGTGNDVFRFTAATDSTPAARDVIRAGNGAIAFEGAGAAAGDRIDLSALDANANVAGIQHFTLGGSHAVGHLWFSESGSDTLLSGNMQGNAAPEFQLVIADGATLASAYTEADFIGLA